MTQGVVNENKNGGGLDLNRLVEVVRAQARHRHASHTGGSDAIDALRRSLQESQGHGILRVARIVSIECLEHSRNYELLFRRLSQVCVPCAICFVSLISSSVGGWGRD